MEFDPDAEKWRCCCWSLPSGLTILALSELLISSISAALFIASSTSEPGFLAYPQFLAIPIGALSTFLALSALLLLRYLTLPFSILPSPPSLPFFVPSEKNERVVVGTRAEKFKCFPIVMGIQLLSMLAVLGISIALILHTVEQKEKTELEENKVKGTNILLILLMPIIGACIIIAVLIYSVYLAQKGYFYFHAYDKLMRKRRERTGSFLKPI